MMSMIVIHVKLTILCGKILIYPAGYMARVWARRYKDISDQMQEQLDAYEQLSDTLDHDMKLIQLVFGEDSYSKLEDYYAKKEQNFNSRLDFQKQQVEFWEQQMAVLEEGSEE